MTSDHLQSKVAIVTGASSGIGKATALALASRVAGIVAASRNQEALQAVENEVRSRGGTILAVATDVTDRVQVRRLVDVSLDRFGKIDVVVCNAGVYPRGPVHTLKIEDYELSMSVNFYGTLNLVYGVLPHMLTRGSGHIVVVSSVDGRKGLPQDAAYVSSKWAVTGFTDVLRQELHGTGVCATAILPGRVDTPMIATLRVPWVSRKISSDRVAAAIVSAIRKRKAESIVPYAGPKTLIILSAISPRLGDWLVRTFRLEGKEETA
jgi:hypothetical protein